VKKAYLLYCRVIICIIFPLLSFGSDVYFDHITIEQELSQNTINCIYQDSEGFMWFGTEDGLNRYDGYNFKIFRQHPLDSNTISHNWIWDICEDENGHIWVATWFGLNRIHTNLNYVTRFLPDKNNQNSVSNSRPTSIKVHKNGNLWIATWGGGINYFDSTSEKFYSFKHDPNDGNSINTNFVRTLYIDTKNYLWIGTWEGLCYTNLDSLETGKKARFVRLASKFQSVKKIGKNKVISIIEDKNGKIWVGTMFNGAYCIDFKKGKVSSYQYDPKKSNSLSSNRIGSIYQDSHNKIWIATQNEGLNYYDPIMDGFIHYKIDKSKSTSLNTNALTKLFEDNSGNLWIGSVTNGINKLNLNRKNFSYFTHSENDKNSLSGDLVRSIFKDDQGYLWIGTEENGLNRYNFKSKQFKHYRHSPKDQNSISHNNIQKIVSDKSGNLWIATFGGGLNKYDGISRKFVHFKHDPKNDQSISSDFIETLFIDPEDKLWIGTSAQGLDRYDLNTKKFEHFKFNIDDPTSLSTNYILSIFQDSFGRLWIGGWGGGLNLYNPEKNNFKRFLHKPADPNSLCDNIVGTIAETFINGKSVLWVGTSGGLSFMNIGDSSFGKFHHFFENDGLPNQHIYGILEDNSQNLWLSTNKGLSKFNPSEVIKKDVTKSKFKNYDTGDGLPQEEFSGGAYFKSTDGNLYFGCSKGLISFNPDSIKSNFYIPPVVITNFQLYTNSASPNDGSTIIANVLNRYNGKVVLSYTDNIFTIEFAALDYAAPQKNKYAYKMKGFQENWIYTDAKKRFATYTNLDPGEYIFQVKGTNSDGYWNDDGTSLKIIINPPWWRTWWSNLIFSFIIIGVLLLAHYFRILYYKKAQKAQEDFSNKLIDSQETERKRIAAELHDSLGQNLLIINNSIKNYNKQINKKNSDLELISSTIKDSISEVREISYNLHPHLLDRLGLKEALNSVINKLSQATNINFKSRIDEVDMLIPENFKIHLFRIVQELLNNVVKHSNATTVNVRIKLVQNHINIIVQDNGKGFVVKSLEDNSMNADGFGLRNISERAKLLGGELKIESNPGKGTKVILKIVTTNQKT
jgi:ligand-binding sensor domain-containing protein/two-component sensor histidine kinase